MAGTNPTGDDVEPTVLEEPGRGGSGDAPDWGDDTRAVWMRGLWMLVFALLFEVARTILAISALLQFLWLLFAKQKNRPIADFGEDLGDWMARVTLFQTGASEARPFPFARWGREG
ncbi:MAG TPA: DUF4389 domain-containing protein [Rhodobacterales bacterium]|nr:DUF4389 domain-containing protein [Rhodobacterales bacterium]